MGLRDFGKSRNVVRAMALALALGIGFAASAPLPARADNEESLFKKWKRQKAGENASERPAAATASQGSASKATTVSGIVNDGSISPSISADSAAGIEAMVAKYEGIVAAGGWPKVPGAKLKKGSTGKPAAALNRRLFVEGYLRQEATEGEFAETFTTATEQALMNFQRNHGLAVTGAVDGATLAALNVSADRRLATLRANVPRLAEYSKDLGSRYIVVNIPAQQIETVSDGKVYSLHNAILGRPSRPTPVVMTPLTVIRFNPYWNAPASIVEKDIVPRMLSRGPSRVMEEMNMKIFKGVGGPEIDPDSVNWRRAVVDDYHFRQEPGGSNAMATAKIEFSSPFGIYLHDTPEPHLFKSGQRFYSSGCVRVEKVATLIDWILQGQDGINSARIAELAETKERLDTTVANAPQLRVAYLTAWPARDGVAAFRPDVYELDGTGYVVGQPLPVGATQGGKRYVLKPIPRTPDAVDADEAVGFASLFRRSDRDGANGSGIPRKRSADDALVDLDTLKKPAAKTQNKTTAKAQTTKTAARKAAAGDAPSKRFVRGEDGKFRVVDLDEAQPSKRKVTKKASTRKTDGKTTKTASAAKKQEGKASAAAKPKKVLKKDEAVAAAKKPTDDKKKVATASAAGSKAKKPVDQKTAKAKPADAAKTASKKPADCKAGTDGKLPEGCKAPAKKPADKPKKTVSAAN